MPRVFAESESAPCNSAVVKPKPLSCLKTGGKMCCAGDRHFFFAVFVFLLTLPLCRPIHLCR